MVFYYKRFYPDSWKKNVNKIFSMISLGFIFATIYSLLVPEINKLYMGIVFALGMVSLQVIFTSVIILIFIFYETFFNSVSLIKNKKIFLLRLIENLKSLVKNHFKAHFSLEKSSYTVEIESSTVIYSISLHSGKILYYDGSVNSFSGIENLYLKRPDFLNQ